MLLKNDGILPLDRAAGSIAVIGPNAKVAQIMGGGSAQLNPHYRVSPWDGLAAALGDEERLAYRRAHEQPLRADAGGNIQVRVFRFARSFRARCPHRDDGECCEHSSLAASPRAELIQWHFHCA